MMDNTGCQKAFRRTRRKFVSFHFETREPPAVCRLTHHRAQLHKPCRRRIGRTRLPSPKLVYRRTCMVRCGLFRRQKDMVVVETTPSFDTFRLLLVAVSSENN